MITLYWRGEWSNKAFYCKNTTTSSGRCNPVNWLSQTKRNLIIEYLNLNLATTPKLTPLHSFYAEKVFVSCAVHYRFVPFRVRTRPSLFDTDILQHTISNLNFQPDDTRRYFQLVEKKKCFAQENAKKVVEGLGTGSIVIVTNVTPRSCGCGEISPGKCFLITCRV